MLAEMNKDVTTCPVNNCVIHNDTTRWINSDLILIPNRLFPSGKRPHQQAWVAFEYESALHTRFSDELNDKINFTASYRFDSTIRTPYGMYTPDEPKTDINKTIQLIKLEDIAKGKDRAVAWIVSNCNPKSPRNAYADELSKYITMPGINLPTSHLGFYALTLLICAFIHEAGHALAAVRERVRLHGFGIFVFGFYPGAFVDLNAADLQSLSPFCQLRVYCAGVWHNAVIAVISIIIFYLLPFLLSPGYHVGTGVGVTYLREDSVVTGHRGLALGDAITRVNSCPVNQQSDWFKCLEEAYIHPSGYCVSGAYLSMIDNKASVPRRSLSAVVSVNKLDENDSFESVSNQNKLNEDCCTVQSASTHLCFTYITPTKLSSTSRRYACLPARAVTERTSCNVTSDCGNLGAIRGNNNGIQSESLGVMSTRSMHCVVPSPPDNSTRLVRLVHNRHKAPAILFLGPLEDLVASIGVSDYVPRWPSILSPNLPSFLGLLCTYLFSLSGALVILNVVPCYALDGQWILKAFLDLCLPGILLSRPKRNMVFTVVLILGSSLLGLNLFLAILYLCLQANYSGGLPNSISPITSVNT
ncbi:unnamed protein product [Schistosoma rodhaini]|nr:unnamed protein product [Schistosoma rodhaini]